MHLDYIYDNYEVAFSATVHHDIILFVVQMGFFTKTIVNFTAKHV